jgi:hypothetical protein
MQIYITYDVDADGGESCYSDASRLWSDWTLATSGPLDLWGPPWPGAAAGQVLLLICPAGRLQRYVHDPMSVPQVQRYRDAPDEQMDAMREMGRDGVPLVLSALSIVEKL